VFIDSLNKCLVIIGLAFVILLGKDMLMRSGPEIMCSFGLLWE